MSAIVLVVIFVVAFCLGWFTPGALTLAWRTLHVGAELVGLVSICLCVRQVVLRALTPPDQRK